MNAEYDELIASFQVTADLEKAVDRVVQSRVEEQLKKPVSAAGQSAWSEPQSVSTVAHEPPAPRVKWVASRVITSRRAA